MTTYKMASELTDEQIIAYAQRYGTLNTMTVQITYDTDLGAVKTVSVDGSAWKLANRADVHLANQSVSSRLIDND